MDWPALAYTMEVLLFCYANLILQPSVAPLASCKGHNASRQASTHGFVNWLGCVLGRLGWMRTMETMSSSPAMAGAHDRLLNGQVSATFSVNDDAYQIFYCSPIHIIDVKSDLLVLKLMA
ncbi:uncharacterized protein LOC119362218 [Triticum dicoccoides]|nr:uncharacterized protein LOC119362218 [Triticum dicoccoides]